MNNEPAEVPKIIPLETRNISANAFERLSKGDINLTHEMKIIGEGNKGNNRRRLQITVKPNDPFLVKFRDDQDWINEMTPRIRELGHTDDAVMRETTTMSSKDMETLRQSVQSHEVHKYIASGESDFSRRSNEIPDGLEESVKLRKELDAQRKEFREQTEYVKYLVSHDAVELILPEEKPDQAPTAVKAGV